MSKIWYLSESTFYFDSYFFAIIVIFLITLLCYSATSLILLVLFAGSVMAGFMGWSIFEYSLHRWVLHGPMVSLHYLHHRNPIEYIGTPNYITIGIFFLLFGGLCVFFSTPMAAALSLGFILGYLYYLFVHHSDHHKTIYPEQMLYGISTHHYRHHHYAGGNYGVTTQIWDRLLRTRL